MAHQVSIAFHACSSEYRADRVTHSVSEVVQGLSLARGLVPKHKLTITVLHRVQEAANILGHGNVNRLGLIAALGREDLLPRALYCVKTFPLGQFDAT